MNDDALRQMVRAALEKRIAAVAPDFTNEPLPIQLHMSHARYVLPDSGGACLIEPAVTCNHCGYCQSHGH